MDHETRRLVQHAWTEIMKDQKAAADHFYSTLFELDPSVQYLFKGDMEQQKERLMEMFSVAVRGLDQLDAIGEPMARLGERHASYGVREEYYDLMGQAFLAMARKTLGDRLNPETEAAFQVTYAFLASAMKDGARS